MELTTVLQAIAIVITFGLIAAGIAFVADVLRQKKPSLSDPRIAQGSGGDKDA